MRCLSLAIVLCLARAEPFAAEVSAVVPPRAIDDARAASAGIRKLAGKHLVLYTDLPKNPNVDRLPALFDEAVPQWAEYFGVAPSQTAGWKAQAYLIADRRPFDALGLMPEGVDEFAHGISMNSEFWLHDQPTAYYRRHLLLHEGTHVFMASFLGACGPEWYMEGIAELFATHRLEDATHRLTLRTMPRDREEVPMLGRIKLVRDAFRAGRALALPSVMQIQSRRQMKNEAYAWCWAAAKFLDAHPRYGPQFRQLKNHVLDEDFNGIARRAYGQDWHDLATEWQAFVATLEHGYDCDRMAIDFEPGEPLGDAPREVKIAVDRGWQSSGVWLDADNSYRITASGQYQVAVENEAAGSRPWPCEPGGITLTYHDGRPLGILLGAVDARPPQAGTPSFAQPIAIGLGTAIAPSASGTLYLRVNDSAGELADNRGTVHVSIERARE